MTIGRGKWRIVFPSPAGPLRPIPSITLIDKLGLRRLGYIGAIRLVVLRRGGPLQGSGQVGVTWVRGMTASASVMPARGADELAV